MLVVDELGLLFEDATIRQFVVALARRIRKYNGGLVFATQNPGDLFSSEAGAVVATNPALHFFGAQRPGEAARLQRAFNLSDTQRTTLEVARRGEFLLAAGGDRIPLRVQAPPWQAAAMSRSRAPPAKTYSTLTRIERLWRRPNRVSRWLANGCRSGGRTRHRGADSRCAASSGAAVAAAATAGSRSGPADTGPTAVPSGSS
jgi:hypothetical protein